MKLSKLTTISLTSAALAIYCMGVFAVQVGAEGVDAGVVLDDSGSNKGFGLTVQNWLEDVQARFNRNPEVLAVQAERALARLEDAAESGDEDAAERLEMARARYEEKLAKLNDLSDSLDENQKQDLLDRVAKHEAVLEHVFENAPEQATAGLQRALEHAAEHRQNVLNRVSDENKEDYLDRIFENRQSILDRLERDSSELSDEQRQRVEERKARLEELKANKLDREVGVRGDGEGAARENLQKRIQQDQIEARQKSEGENKDAREKFSDRVREVDGRKVDRVAPLGSEDIRKVQGAVDYQPVGFWEKIGYWLGW